MSTESVFKHHLDAVVRGDVDDIMSDYAPNAVLFHQQGTETDAAGIREFMTALGPEFEKLLPEFEMLHQAVQGDFVYIVWKSGDAVPLGTDTFLIQNDKIVMQSFAAHMPG